VKSEYNELKEENTFLVTENQQLKEQLKLKEESVETIEEEPIKLVDLFKKDPFIGDKP
jgi:regulator of replication initiation timing